jgi:uncharacterized protein YjbI with pentapeptide repeats
VRRVCRSSEEQRILARALADLGVKFREPCSFRGGFGHSIARFTHAINLAATLGWCDATEVKEGQPVQGVADLRARRAWGQQDLRNANLRNADLRRQNFAQVDFSDACFVNSNLARAYLPMVNFERAALTGSNMLEAYMPRVKLRGADMQSVILEGAELRGADLASTNLRRVKADRGRFPGANFEEADLSRGTFERSDLTMANLHRAKMVGTLFNEANLSGASIAKGDLRKAVLKGATLTGAECAEADLRGADLTDATLSLCHLSQANLARAEVGGTRLLSIDLTQFCGSGVLHRAPSFVDFRSVMMSVRAPGLRGFLCETGMPPVFADYMIDCARSLSEEEIFSLMRSTFISYGKPDEGFAKKLNDALAARGVKTFFFKEHAVPGEKLHRMMRVGVNAHDRIIVICSEASLPRAGVLNEIEESLARESREGGMPSLIPVRLDDHVFSNWCPERPDLAQALRDRVIADFSDHANPESFESEIARLIKALKKPIAIT